MKNLKENFCRYLFNWKRSSFTGTQKDLGEKFGVSQSQIAKILSGDRWGDELWRRDVAKKIGVKYEIMIGLEEEQIDFKNIEKLGKDSPVLNFEDQKRANRIIQKLIKIEGKNKKAFQDIDVYISGVEKGLKYQDDSKDEDLNIDSAKKTS